MQDAERPSGEANGAGPDARLRGRGGRRLESEELGCAGREARSGGRMGQI